MSFSKDKTGSYVNPESINGRRLCLVFWAQGEDGEQEAAYFTGTAHYKSGKLRIDRGRKTNAFLIPEQLYPEITKVSEEIKEILSDAEYMISLVVDELPEFLEKYDMENTGFKWPE